jgi:hypothetical protein
MPARTGFDGYSQQTRIKVRRVPVMAEHDNQPCGVLMVKADTFPIGRGEPERRTYRLREPRHGSGWATLTSRCCTGLLVIGRRLFVGCFGSLHQPFCLEPAARCQLHRVEIVRCCSERLDDIGVSVLLQQRNGVTQSRRANVHQLVQFLAFDILVPQLRINLLHPCKAK